MKVILVGSVILLNLVSIAFMFGLRRSEDIIGILLINVLISVVIQAVLSFYMWNAINDGKSPVNPYLAAGLHFIPVFGFLWTLISFGMYSAAFNNYTDRKHAEDKNFNALYMDPSPFNLYIVAACVSIICMFIPLIKIIVPFVMLILYLRVIATACGGIEDLKFSKEYAYSINTNQPLPTANNSLKLNI
jgi:ABC-type transport system involved in cytochrome c biogenesis permease component